MSDSQYFAPARLKAMAINEILRMALREQGETDAALDDVTRHANIYLLRGKTLLLIEEIGDGVIARKPPQLIG